MLPLSMVSSHLLFRKILCAEANNVCAHKAQTCLRLHLCHSTPATQLPGFSCFFILFPGTENFVSPRPLEKDSGGKCLFQTDARKMSAPPKQWYDFILDDESLSVCFFPFSLAIRKLKENFCSNTSHSLTISPLHLANDSSSFSIHVLVVLLNLYL